MVQWKARLVFLLLIAAVAALAAGGVTAAGEAGAAGSGIVEALADSLGWSWG